ncbi:hypothetical protein CHS0354_004276 [Potamilus streckersoni]|uniref:ATP synthase-coupling factor 6, mitochondrial n=1 Tax=Potamilus streckersoni TaxID=2493646 RepID=A0AAE0S4G7_9BIVA|nr:hypothetical protein CHS0354_004276 [Potamilus streckersoni]
MLTQLVARSAAVRSCLWHQLHRNLGVTAVFIQKASTATDPIQQLFVSKIREYAQKSKSAGGKLVDATPDQQKAMQDELEKIQRIYNAKGQDMTKFPVFNFTDPTLEPVDLGDIKMELAEVKDEVAQEEEDDITNVPYFEL